MKCAKCRSEIGNQQVCPYCGSVIAEETGAWYAKPAEGYLHPNPAGSAQNKLIRYIKKLETRINLLLVLTIANFFLLMLVLVVLVMK